MASKERLQPRRARASESPSAENERRDSKDESHGSMGPFNPTPRPGRHRQGRTSDGGKRPARTRRNQRCPYCDGEHGEAAATRRGRKRDGSGGASS